MSLLSQALFSAQSLDGVIRASSLRTLEDLSHTNPVEYLMNLSIEMSNASSPPQVRQLAGLLIKNLVNNSTKDPRLEQVWQKADPKIKSQVRSNTLGTLASEDKDVRLTCSQTVAALACLDIPLGQWLEVLDILITNSTNLNKIFKVSALRTLGYICEGLPTGSVAKEQANQILTALASSMDASERDPEIKSVALTAFRNSLRFIESNISNQGERMIIMNLLYTCCTEQELNIRREAMMIICDVLSLYYDFLDTNLIELGNLTYNLIKNDHVNVAIYAVEFWNQAADEEVERLRFHQKPCKGYINTAAASLVPLLLEKIHFIESDSDEWNLHKACASTLGSVSMIIGDAILALVGGYITAEIKSEVWEKRVSAAVIIGSIVEGVNDIQNIVQFTFKSLVHLLNDPVTMVKETAAWSISKIAEFHSKFLIENGLFNEIIKEIVGTLEKSPKMATHGCWTIMNLFDKNDLSGHLNAEKVLYIVENLISTSLRGDAYNSDHDLLLASYSALNKLFEELPEEYMPTVTQKIPFFLSILVDSPKSPNSTSIQSHVCSALHSIFGRSLEGSINEALADQFVTIVVSIFQSRSTVFEEGLQALGTLAENMHERFEKYVTTLMPFIDWAIDQQTSAISKSGVMAAGDLSRALKENFAGYVSGIIPKLLNILANNQINFDVKVRAIDTLADFASHTTREVAKYLQEILRFIEGASETSLDLRMEQANPDLGEYLLELRESIMSFYVGILQGLHDIQNTGSILGYLPKILDYAMVIVQTQYHPNVNVHASVVGLIGDVASFFENKAAPFIKNNKIELYLNSHSNTNSQEISALVDYARERIKLI